MFTFAESGAISHTNTMTTLGSRSGWNSSFTTETSLERECRLEIQREHRRKKRTARKRGAERPSFSTTKTTPSARKRGTGAIESGFIIFSSRKPFTCLKKKMIYVAANLLSSSGLLPMYGSS